MVTGYAIAHFDMAPFVDASNLNLRRMMDRDSRLHFMPYNYLPAYFIGILLGHFVANNVKLSAAKTKLLGWIIGPGS